MIFVHRTVSSGQRTSFVDRLPPGDGANDFKLNITVEVQDALGAKSLQNLSVKVLNLFKAL